MSATTVVLAGVGGQGTVLAGDILAHVAVAEGMSVKLSEIHGMAQRGGSVQTIVRFGDVVHSPVVDPGTADLLIAFELIEAGRALQLVNPKGHLVVNTLVVPSLPMLTGEADLPAGLAERLHAEGALLLDAEALACEADSPRSPNVVLLGAASPRLPFADETWYRVIETRVPPKTVDANLRAFQLGREASQARN